MLRSWRELRGARRAGTRNGRTGIPTVEDALPFALLEITSREQERVQHALRRWRVTDRERQLELGDVEQRAVAAAVKLEHAEAELGAARQEHERHVAEEGERLARLQEQLDELPAAELPTFAIDEPSPPLPAALVVPIAGGATASPALVPTDQRLEPIERDVPLDDVTWRGLGPVAYWALIALIVLGEVPLNAFAFRLFRESDLLTYVMTVTVAIGLVAFAHAVGLFLARPEPTRVEHVLVAVFVALPVAAIGVIALVRYGYLGEVGETGIGPVLGTLAFGLINLLVFGAAAGLSYLHHDPRTLVSRRARIRAAERDLARSERRRDEQERAQRDRRQRLLDEQHRREEDLRRALLQQERERRREELELQKERSVAELEARRRERSHRREELAEATRVIRGAAREREERLHELTARLDGARAELGQAQRAVEALGAERRGLWEAIGVELAQIRAHRDRLVFAYCAANVRARTGHVTPTCLRGIPPLEIPSGFEQALEEAA